MNDINDMKTFNILVRNPKKGELTIRVQATHELEAIKKAHGLYGNIITNHMTGKETYGNKVAIVKVREYKENK